MYLFCAAAKNASQRGGLSDLFDQFNGPIGIAKGSLTDVVEVGDLQPCVRIVLAGASVVGNQRPGIGGDPILCRLVQYSGSGFFVRKKIKSRPL